jgi:DnaJ-domain-containing protein 1
MTSTLAAEMAAYDSLPPILRRAISQARFRFASVPAAKRAETRDAAGIAEWINFHDDQFALRAYIERDFDKSEALILIDFDKVRRDGN